MSAPTQDDVLDPLPSPGGGRFIPRTVQKVALGPLTVEFRSNERPFTELHYFPESVWLPSHERIDYTVSCCNMVLDGPWPLNYLRHGRDRNYRGGRFAAGYYLTDHFGPPAYLITQGQHLWIFATDFGPILWPFVVKLLLTIASIDRGMLHLKAAAVSIANRVTLLLGRGGTGKTVLLSQLCKCTGAHFLANTHVLVDGREIKPVVSTLRIRNDRLFGSLIAARPLPPALKPGEYLVDPCADLGWSVARGGLIHNLCLMDYRGDGPPMVDELDRKILLDYMENFSLALNIYGLREDMLDHLGGDVTRFSMEWSAMRERLEQLVQGSQCFYIRCDATDPENLRQIERLLSRA